MTTQTSSNIKLWIGPKVGNPPASVAAYKALVGGYVEVGQIMNLGEYGDSNAVVTAEYLNSARAEKYKGIADGGTLQLQVGYDAADPGHIALKAARREPDNYAFKITFDDQIDDEDGHPSADYFSGQVLTASKNVGGPNTVLSMNVQIGINSETLEEAAA